MYISILLLLYCSLSFAIVDIMLIVSPHYSILTNCIRSIIRHEADRNIIHQRVIFVLNNSTVTYPFKLIAYMKSLCENDSIHYICSFQETIKDHSEGLERKGIQILSMSEAIKYPSSIGREESDMLIILSCYTVVTNSWLLTLYHSIMQYPNLGIIIPISNNGGIYSMPYTLHNSLPIGLSVDELVKNLQHFLKQRKDIEPYILLNNKDAQQLMIHSGCLVMRKEVYHKITGGWISEDVENMEIKIRQLGYKIAIVPSTYIYIHDSNTAMNSNIVLSQQAVSSSATLNKVKLFITSLYKETEDRYLYAKQRNASILFVLHDIAVGGGIVSVLQEALQMHRYGIKVAVSVPVSSANWQPLKLIQAMLPTADRITLNHLIQLHKGSTFYPSPFSNDFHNIAKQYDIIVATYCMTMFSVEKVCQYNSTKLPAYYVQDYEPWTWSSPFDKQDENGFWITEAKRSYTANNKQTYMIAKTKWTAQMVHKYHDMTVHKVVPSLDHHTYYPNQTELALKLTKTFSTTSMTLKDNCCSVINILAMIRPRTPRRNPELTLELVLKLAYEFGNHTMINLFGALPDDIMKARDNLEKLKGLAPHRSKEFMKSSQNIRMLGIVLERNEIADLYRKTDVFIDLSWWQAFGRAGVEAMACGVVAVMPSTGAAPDICGNKEYCLYHNGLDEQGFYHTLKTVIVNDTLRHSLILNGLKRTTHYSISSAAASMANELIRGYSIRLQNRKILE